MAIRDFERETTIGTDDSTKQAEMITFNKALMRKMDKYCKDYPDDFKHVSDQVFDDKVEGKEYVFPWRLVTIRAPKKMTEEQRKSASARMKKMQAEKKDNDK